MNVSINRHALDRVPLSIIFDDSTMLINLNYFFLREQYVLSDGNCFHSHFRAVSFHQLLSVVAAVEWPAVRTQTGVSMISPHDQTVRTIVAADHRMPERLPWTGHPHRKRQERQQDPVSSIMLRSQDLISPHARVVIDIPWLGHPHSRVQQQCSVQFLDGPLRERFMGSVQRITGLKSHNLRAA